MSTLDLINAISIGDAVGTEVTFNSAMAEKISVKLDDMRANIAQNMFAVSNQEQEPSED